MAWGKVNRPIDPEQFDLLVDDLTRAPGGRELFVQDCRAGADPAFTLPVRVITEHAWHSLFARHLFIAPTGGTDRGGTIRQPRFTVIDAPSFTADPARHGTGLRHLHRCSTSTSGSC